MRHEVLEEVNFSDHDSDQPTRLPHCRSTSRNKTFPWGKLPRLEPDQSSHNIVTNYLCHHLAPDLWLCKVLLHLTPPKKVAEKDTLTQCCGKKFSSTRFSRRLQLQHLLLLLTVGFNFPAFPLSPLYHRPRKAACWAKTTRAIASSRYF